MRKWSCTSEVVTPMFLAGADQTVAALCRPACIRGVTRFWFRAVMGGLLDGNWQEINETIRKLEAHVFGDTQQASKTRARLDVDTHERKNIEKINGNPIEVDPGLVYLGFPFYDWGGRKKHLLAREYVRPSSPGQRSSFHIQFSFRQTSKMLENVVYGALWLIFQNN